MSVIRLHIRHIRQAGYCASGARAWAKRHNINYTEFLQNGIDVEVFEQIGDHFAMHVCHLAREEAAQQEVSNGQG